MFVSADKKPRQFKGHILIVVRYRAVLVDICAKLSCFLLFFLAVARGTDPYP